MSKLDEHDWVCHGQVNPNPHAISWKCSKCSASRIQETKPEAKTDFDVKFKCTCDLVALCDVMEASSWQLWPDPEEE